MTEQRFCAFCGTPTVPAAVFCVKCGQPVAGAAPAPAPAQGPGGPVVSAPVAPPADAGAFAPPPPAPYPAPAASLPAPAAGSAPPPPAAMLPPTATFPPPAGAMPPPAAYLPPAAAGSPPPAALGYPPNGFAPPPSGGYPAAGFPAGAGGPRIVQAPPPGAAFGAGPGAPSFLAGQRPLGIMIIAVLAGIGALVGLWTGLQYLQAADYWGAASDTVRGIGFIILLVSVAWIVVAWGLWTLRPWAWIAAGAVAGVSVGLQVLALVNDSRDPGGSLIQIVANAAIIYYLSTPPVRAIFRHPAGIGPRGG